MVEKTCQVIYLINRYPAGGGDHRFAGISDCFDQRPIVRAAACDLDNVHSVLGAFAHRRFIEGSHDYQHFLPPNRLNEFPEIGVCKPCIQKPGDMFDVFSLLECRMDEAIEVAVLKLNCRADFMASADLSQWLNNFQPVLDLALMVIGHFEDEQILKYWIHNESCGCLQKSGTPYSRARRGTSGTWAPFSAR